MPAHQVHQRAVLDPHAFGFARRARGEDHISQLPALDGGAPALPPSLDGGAIVSLPSLDGSAPALPPSAGHHRRRAAALHNEPLARRQRPPLPPLPPRPPLPCRSTRAAVAAARWRGASSAPAPGARRAWSSGPPAD